jgi:DNA-binding NtrC family response regulator
MRILIAKDDSVLSGGLSRSLRGSGYAVDTVADGEKRTPHRDPEAFGSFHLSDLAAPAERQNGNPIKFLLTHPSLHCAPLRERSSYRTFLSC